MDHNIKIHSWQKISIITCPLIKGQVIMLILTTRIIFNDK